MADPVHVAGRRAAALLAHYLDGNAEGIDAVMQETSTGTDTFYLIVALLGLFEHVLQGGTAEDRANIRGAILSLARLEAGDEQ